MASSNKARSDERALRTIEAVHGEIDDVPAVVSPNSASMRRMRTSIDQAFDQAWRVRRELAKAESQRRGEREQSFFELAGHALRARIANLQALLGAQLQLAHRNLADMTDDDLRSLLADVEEVAARKGLLP